MRSSSRSNIEYVGADVGIVFLPVGLDLGMCVRAESEENSDGLQCEAWCHLNTSSDKRRGVRSTLVNRVTRRS